MSSTGSGRRVERRLRDPSRRPPPAPVRVARAWRKLPTERRLAAVAAIALFLTLFLPWYQETVIAAGVSSLRSIGESLTGWGAFSFVEAAVLLVATGVLALLFTRAEGRAFHLPGGDGAVITAAGLWACVLIVWRIFDKQGTSGHGQLATTSGIEWGIFVALGVAALLAYAGSRIRIAHEPEPPLPGERERPTGEIADDTVEHGPPVRVPNPSAPVRAARRSAAGAGDRDPTDHPTRLSDPEATPRGPVPRGPLDRRDIEELEIAEPPTARLSRIPSRFAPSEPGDSDDPLTLRLDRPR